LFPFRETVQHIEGLDALGIHPLDCPTGFAVRLVEVQYIVLVHAIGKTDQWGRVQVEHSKPVQHQSVEHDCYLLARRLGPRPPEHDLRRPLRTINQTDGELHIFIPIPHQRARLHLHHHVWGRKLGFWRFMLDASHRAGDVVMVNKRLDGWVPIAEAI
jgi:hypothetical protein